MALDGTKCLHANASKHKGHEPRRRMLRAEKAAFCSKDINALMRAKGRDPLMPGKTSATARGSWGSGAPRGAEAQASAASEKILQTA